MTDGRAGEVPWAGDGEGMIGMLDTPKKLSHAEHVAKHHAVAQYKPIMGSFRHGVEASTDVRIQGLRRAFDNDGYAVYWTLVERVYANGGELALGNAGMLKVEAGLCWVTTDRLVKIIDWCCGVGLFSKEEWQKRTVVTSAGIKADIKKAEERKNIQISRALWHEAMER